MATIQKKPDLKTQLETRKDAVVTIKDFLEKNMDVLKQALPRHLEPERFARLVTIEIRKNPKLSSCSFPSIVGAMLQGVQLGLEPGPLGHVFFVPYWNNKTRGNECQLQVGYQGLIELARRSSAVSHIFADVVYERDEFTFHYGSGQQLRHKPSFTGDRGKPVASYMFVRFSDGAEHFHVMSIEEINAIMARSKSRDKAGNVTGPWATDWAEMAKKTVLRRGIKYVPKSVEEIRKVIAADETTVKDIAPDLAMTARDVTDWDSMPETPERLPEGEAETIAGRTDHEPKQPTEKNTPFEASMELISTASLKVIDSVASQVLAREWSDEQLEKLNDMIEARKRDLVME